MNNWTKEEIALTRRAWLMYDMDQIDRYYRSKRVKMFLCVGIILISTTFWVLT